MGYICPWNRKALSYDGACSHCSLNDSISSHFNVTAEQRPVWIAAASAADAKSLPPNRPTLRWGVYAVVLEKPNCRPILYVGSGTNSSFEVAARFQHYDEREHLPQYVAKALFDGNGGGGGMKVVVVVRGQR